MELVTVARAGRVPQQEHLHHLARAVLLRRDVRADEVHSPRGRVCHLPRPARGAVSLLVARMRLHSSDTIPSRMTGVTLP